MKYLYDTNIFIYYFAEEPEVLRFFSESFLSQNEAFISPIVRIESLSFPGLPSKEEAVIDGLLTQFERIPMSPQVEDRTLVD